MHKNYRIGVVYEDSLNPDAVAHIIRQYQGSAANITII